MILVIDNYDSFVYNLVQYVGEVSDVVVRRNDALTLAEVRELDPDGIVVSPGPGRPESAGIIVDLFAETAFPTLGVCLGHQACCAAAGTPVVQAPAVVHGKPSTITHDGRGIFADLPGRFDVGRYHSLTVEAADLPESLEPTAHTDEGVLMAVRHREKPHVGVQFHPESILTRPIEIDSNDSTTGEPVPTHPDVESEPLWLGKRLVSNFLEAYPG